MIRDIAGSRGSKFVFWGVIAFIVILNMQRVHNELKWLWDTYSDTPLVWGNVLASIFVLGYVLAAMILGFLIIAGGLWLCAYAVGWGFRKGFGRKDDE